MSASTNPQSDNVAQVLHFNDQSRILELEKQLAEVTEKYEQSEIQSNARGAFIRAIAQKYFSQDPNSFYFAGLSKDRPEKDCPVSKKEAITHWAKNGGPEAFAAQFPTPEDVMKFFLRLHNASKDSLDLTHLIAG